MKTRLYKVTHGTQHRLVRASSQAMARNHVAKSSISVEVASIDDIYLIVLSGVFIEEAQQRASAKESGKEAQLVMA